MTAHNALEVHPEITVVELVLVTGARTAGDDGATASDDEDRDTERGLTDEVEDDVGVLAHRRPDGPAQPFAQFDGAVGRERVIATQADLVPVDDDIASESTQNVGLFFRTDHTDGYSARILDQLHGEGSETTGRPPDEDDVALLDAGPVVADQHPVGRGGREHDARRLLPGQMRGLASSWLARTTV